jgi:hypothetical protein
MEMQLDKTNPDDEITHTVSYLTATSSGGSATIKSEMFSKDGYMYTDMAGQKTKQYLPKDDEDEENPVSLALKYLSTAVYTENADGSLTVSVTVEASKNEEAKKAFISLFDMGMTEKEIRLCTTTDAIIEFVIDKDNNLKSFSFPIEYSLVQTISGSSSLYSTVVKYTMSMTVDSIGGSFVITLPSDLDSYR